MSYLKSLGSYHSYLCGDGNRFQRLFPWLVQATIFVLPWQTRWFSDASLGGWPWEQGRVSIYLSWFLLVATIGVGHHLSSRKLSASARRTLLIVVGGLAATSILAVIFSQRSFAFSGRPVLMWWIETLLLGAFAFTLWRTRFSAALVLRAFVWSLVPHAVLGLFQTMGQSVFASKWLGMAAHLPATPGTSVLDIAGTRILRVYGGFPHPNIFGGWLVGGILASLQLALRSFAVIPTNESSRNGGIPSRPLYILYGSIAVFFTWTLIQTYARGAWIALAVSLIVLFFSQKLYRRRSALVLLGVIFLVTTLTFLTHPERLRTRLTATGRLEEKSLNDRVTSFAVVPFLIQRHPLVGTGPNAELPELLHDKTVPAPLEPPHAAPLLALVDVGILGIFCLGYGPWSFLRATRCRVWPWFMLLVALSLFDHYLWSFWSGRTLVTLLALFALLDTLDGEGRTLA
jgi:O-antigen ligase